MKRFKNVCAVMACVVLMASFAGCAGKKAGGSSGGNPDSNIGKADETVEDRASETEDEDKDPDAIYRRYQLFVDDMSDRELFDFCHGVITTDFKDGEDAFEFAKRAVAAKPDVDPVDMSAKHFGIEYEYYGVVFGKEQRDYIDTIFYLCDTDLENSTISHGSSSTQAWASSVSVQVYSGRGRALYDLFKEQYLSMLPGGEVIEYEKTSEGYIDFKITTENGELAHIRLIHQEDSDRLYVEEMKLIQK